jgi:hypothetical protein
MRIGGNIPKPWFFPVPILSLGEYQEFQGRTFRLAPPLHVWISAATCAAQEAGIKPGAIIGGSMQKNVCMARWMAWKRLLDSNPRYSLAGLARVSGWHHTTIMYGMRRLAGEGPNYKRPKPMNDKKSSTNDIS